MKKIFNSGYAYVAITALFLAVMQTDVFAQDKVIVDTGEAKSWLSENWMWLAGIALLLIILLAVGSSRSRRTTTVRDNNLTGTTTTSTTVEED